MNQQDLISVIVPVYNVEDYLPKCLSTIARQTYKNLEIILVDDGSTDSSGRICDEFAKNDKRTVVIHKDNEGQGPARNDGQRISNGAYIMFVDGDDYIHSDAVEILYEAINQNAKYDFAMMNYKITCHQDEDTNSRVFLEQSELSQTNLVEGYFGGSSLFNPVWNKLYKKELIKDLWARNYKRGQDSDYTLRVIFLTKMAIWIKAPLYFYFQRENSVTHHPDYVIIGYKCHAQFLFDNINSLTTENNCYMHYLLRDFYRVMIHYIAGVWNCEEKDLAIRQCRQYEKSMRRLYWQNKNIGIVEKLAMTFNVRYPQTVRWLKRIVGNHFSWHMLSKF